MIDLYFDEITKDVLITDFDLVLIRDVDELKQYLISSLRLVRGEWRLDVTAGIPYVEEVLGKLGQEKTVQGSMAVIKEAILNTPGVNSLLQFEPVLDSSNRSVTLTFKVDTIYGPVEVREVF